MDYSNISVDIGTYLVKTKIFVKTHANHGKKVVSPKKITRVDDMIIHNLVKYIVRIRIHLWDIKIINFKNLLFLYLTNEFKFGKYIL